MTFTPDQIIAAFDEIRCFIWGDQYARYQPYKDDAKTAERWIEHGITLPIASVVFFQRMSLMHERWLRDDVDDRSNLPNSLKVFDEDIRIALIRLKGNELSHWDKEESKWLARLNGFKKNQAHWNVDMWGERPDHPDCRAPQHLLIELKFRKKK